MLLNGQSRLFCSRSWQGRALQVGIISERGKSGDEASHGEPQGSSSQAAGVLQGARMVLEQRRVAVQAMAYAQACHAMQTFISRSLPLQVRPGPSHSNKMGKQGKLFSDRMLKVLTGT